MQAQVKTEDEMNWPDMSQWESGTVKQWLRQRVLRIVNVTENEAPAIFADDNAWIDVSKWQPRDAQRWLRRRVQLVINVLEDERLEREAREAEEDRERRAEEDRLAAERLAQEKERQEQAEKQRLITELEDKFKAFWRDAYGHLFGVGDVHFHFVKKCPEHLRAFERLELQFKKPLSMTDVEVQELGWTWLYEPGIHLALLEDGRTAFAARFTPEAEVQDKEKVKVVFETILRSHTCHPIVENNAAQHFPQHRDANGKVVQVDDKDQYAPPSGYMTALGYSGSYDPAFDLRAYKVYDDTPAEEYEAITTNLPLVRQFYDHGICTLVPAAAKAMKAYCARLGIPSFEAKDVTLENLNVAIANSLTITSDEFKNFSHTDNDVKMPVHKADEFVFEPRRGEGKTDSKQDTNAQELLEGHTYGCWFMAESERRGKSKTPYHFWHRHYRYNPDLDHSLVKGGQFVWPEYGYGIDFERSGKGIVEIYWHGATDVHGTLASQSASGVTRIGTSIQITRRGAIGTKKWVERGGKQERVLLPEDIGANLNS